MTSVNENRQNTLYLRKKSVVHVMPFSKMEVQFELQLIWWENVTLLGLKVCFTTYDLFIVTTVMLDTWHDHQIQY
jgi:hypothetical protein